MSIQKTFLLSIPLLLPSVHAQTELENKPQDSSGIQQLERIVVTADQQVTESYVPRAFGGTRSEIPILETPQSVRVLSKQQLDDISATRLADTFDYVSGVSRQNNFAGLWENYAVRGFSGDSRNAGLGYLLNGYAANRGFNSPRDSANTESVEFLKGPSAALFGASDPGGTINVVTKKPLWERQHSIGTQVGSYDFFRQTFDTTGPLTDDFAYRFNYAFEDANSFRDFVGNQRELYAPAFTWKVGERTTIDYNGEFLFAKNDFDRGVFAINGQLGVVPIDRFFGEPNDDPIENDNITNQLSLKHEFNDEWYVRAGVSNKINSLYGFATEPRNVLANQTQRRRYRFRDYDSTDWSAQAELHGKFDTGTIGHQIIVGTDAFTYEIDQILLSGNYAANIDINNPVYGQPKPALTGRIFDRTESQESIAFFAQDQISLGDQWKLLLGLRAENSNQELDDRVVNRVTKRDYQSLIPRAALTWLPNETMSTYLSYSQSFRPSQGTDQNFEAFDPEEGEAYELGFKYQNKEETIGATLAFFNIEKDNVLVTDPSDPNQTFLVNGGGARSQGVELDLSGQLTESFRLSLGMTYQNAEISDSKSVFPNGTPLLNVPEKSAHIFGIQEFELKNGGKIGLGAGLVYAGERSGNPENTFELPSYTTVKALSYWQVNENLRVTLDVDNVFDKTHYVASLSENIVQPGTPRFVTLGMDWKF